ncbi:DNA repair protein RecO [uncultured Sphaerochaeta sp.]|uniref:DNA repair protein RecO n=1 Tax=uncultured Sphaerochaeta sp. TaxID=886478 RepID=UPI002A0A7D80|nr:DNA repair protein RecO [uncultured Sphaerochaeta sp.]
MERNVSSLAIVVHSQRYGQLHRKLKLLTVDFGLIDVVSYGARKSVKAVKAEVFLDGQFFLYFNPVKKSYTLSDVQVVATHDEIRSDLGSTYAALFFCEMILNTNGGDSPEQYALLSKALDMLVSHRELANRILIQFIWKLIAICGLQSNLERCPICDRIYDKDEILSFNSQLSAPCCSGCATLDSGMELPPGARRYLLLTSSLDFILAVFIELSETATQRIKNYLLRYASIVSGKALKTLAGGLLQSQL